MGKKTKVYKVTVAFKPQEFWIKTHSKKFAKEIVMIDLLRKGVKRLVDNKNTSIEEHIE